MGSGKKIFTGKIYLTSLGIQGYSGILGTKLSYQKMECVHLVCMKNGDFNRYHHICQHLPLRLISGPVPLRCLADSAPADVLARWELEDTV